MLRIINSRLHSNQIQSLFQSLFRVCSIPFFGCGFRPGCHPKHVPPLLLLVLRVKNLFENYEESCNPVNPGECPSVKKPESVSICVNLWPAFVFFSPFVVQKPQRCIGPVGPPSFPSRPWCFKSLKDVLARASAVAPPSGAGFSELQPSTFSFSLPAAQAAVCDGSVPGCDGICDGFTHA